MTGIGLRRRRFIKHASIAVAALACPVPSYFPQKKWTIGTLIPDHLPFLKDFQQQALKVLSAKGRVEALDRTQTLERFANPSQSLTTGELDFVFSVPFNWQNLDPAFLLLSANRLPYKDLKLWMNSAKGQKAWQKLYEDWDLTAIPFGNSGPHIGHWHFQPIQDENPYINSKVNMFHLNAQIAEIMGGKHHPLTPQSALAHFASGDLKVFEWQGPFLDHSLGLGSLNAICYSNYWSNPSEAPVIQFQLVCGKKTWSSLSNQVRESLAKVSVSAEKKLNPLWMAADLSTIEKLKKLGTQLSDFPQPFSRQLSKTRQLAVEAIASSSTKTDLISRIVLNSNT